MPISQSRVRKDEEEGAESYLVPGVRKWTVDSSESDEWESESSLDSYYDSDSEEEEGDISLGEVEVEGGMERPGPYMMREVVDQGRVHPLAPSSLGVERHLGVYESNEGTNGMDDEEEDVPLGRIHPRTPFPIESDDWQR